MKWKILAFLICFLCLNSSLLHALEQKVVQVKGLEFWTETFGKREDPALLLIMGSGAQGLSWHQKFCEQLANKGFYVIRYDHRDVGLSSHVDYKESPYTLLDMAKDSIDILNEYGIQKAHIVGASMGGPIAMLIGAHFPDRVSTLTLMVTSPDMRSNLDALQGKPSESSLSPPQLVILSWIKSLVGNPPKTLPEKMKNSLEGSRILNGVKVPFDEELNHQLALQGIMRTRDPLSMFNHLKALEASYDLYKQALTQIKAPTLILHGDQDPIFPIDHSEALKQAIPHAELVIIPGMGHVLNTHFYTILIDKIVGITKEAVKKNECSLTDASSVREKKK